MKISIDDKICREYRLDLPLVCTIILLSCGKSYDSCIKELLNRDILEEVNSVFGKQYSITNRWVKRISQILTDSEISKTDITNERIKNLATSLKELYPKGIKPGTNSYWRGNQKDIEYRIKKFFLKYGKTYSDEQIINATKAYVENYQTNTTLMRTLPYFIMKDDNSDLVTVLENANEDGSFSNSGSYDVSEVIV